MGYYINRPDGQNHGKAKWLIEAHGAELLPSAPEWRDDRAIVCVVDNGMFEAAGYCYHPHELAEFASPDTGERQRSRQWLLMDKDVAETLSGYRTDAA